MNDTGHVRPRAALYIRVSTGAQTAENQRPELEQLARTRGLAVVATFEEAASAAKRRPVFERMMEGAKRGLFDVVAVWSLDRFGRSMAGNLAGRARARSGGRPARVGPRALAGHGRPRA
jgi:DNA invertase Pin-like site-specific DNA recombinase